MAEQTLKDLIRSNKESHDDTPGMDLSPIKSLLGEGLPEIDETQTGRIRLIRAIVQKFGTGYRAHPEVVKVLNHYDKESKDLKLFKKTLRECYGR